jgi:hypothetical protein
MRSVAAVCVLLFAYVLTPNYASAASGGEGGNGGEVVACRDSIGNLKSVEILDSFEGRVLRGMVADLGSSTLTLDQKIQLVIQRLRVTNPTRFALYQKWAENFFTGVTWVDATLPATNDIDPSIFPQGCAIEQIAIQDNNRLDVTAYARGPSLRVNRSLWQSLSSDQQAILVLHEIIYHEALSDRVRSAEPIRYLNQILFSNRLNSLSLKDYAQVLSTAGLSEFDYKDLRILTKPFIKEDTLTSAVEQPFHYRSYSLTVEKGGVIRFTPEGTLKLIDLTGSNIVTTPAGSFNVTGRVEFSIDNPNVVTLGTFYSDAVVSSSNTSLVSCAHGSKFGFVGSQLRYCSLLIEGSTVKTPSSTYKVDQSGDLCLLPDGEISFAWWSTSRSPSILSGTILIGNKTFEITGLGKHFYEWFESKLAIFFATLKSPAEIEYNGDTIRIAGTIMFGVEQELYGQPEKPQKIRLMYFEPIASQTIRFGAFKLPVRANAKCQKADLSLNGIYLDYFRPNDIWSAVLDKDVKFKNRDGDFLVKSGKRAYSPATPDYAGTTNVYQSETCIPW